MKNKVIRNRPVLTITMPVYNVEKYLKRGIESVLNQRYTNIELIIVDDGSTDDSGKICDYYAGVDNRIKVIHQKNQGLVTAREVALENASGDYIGFVDPDDWVEEDFFEKIIEEMERTESSIGVGGYVLEYEDGNIQNRFKNKKNIMLSRDEGLKKLFDFEIYQWELWDKVYKKDIINNIFVDRKITCGEDLLRVYPAFCRAKKICVIPLYGYHYMQRKGSMTHCKRTFNNTVFYAMSILDEMIKKESDPIKQSYQLRKNRFLIIDMFNAFCKGGVDKGFISELDNQWENIVFGTYPVRFKIAAMALELITKFKICKIN